MNSDPPAPPDPIRTASAATATNVSTSVANAFLNNTNQITPQGKLNYDVTGNHSWTDPTTGQSYQIPTFTATQTLSPAQQAISDQSNRAEVNMAGIAADESQKIAGLLSSPFNPNSGPAAGDPNLFNVGNPATTFGQVGDQQRSLGNYGQQQTTFGDAGNITRDYGPADNFSADRGRVEESLYGRLNPQLEKDRARIEQQLADQGIRYGSPAYAAAMDDYNRQSTDARLAVTAAGGAEQQRMMDMAAQRAGFQNAAQQQAYTQAKGRGEFANAAQGQQFLETLQSGTFANQAQKDAFQQEATRAEFGNAGLAQQLAQRQAQFGAQNQTRNQFISEQYAARNQPINEITALLSGSQVQNPNFVNTPSNQIPTVDMAGLINNRFSQDMDTYKQQSANFNSLMGGIFGMMGGLAKSDRREKEDIDKVGTVFAAGPDGEKPLPIYDYKFKDDDSGARHRGPMAQDVERIDKKAVRSIGGVKHIDVTRLGSILKVA